MYSNRCHDKKLQIKFFHSTFTQYNTIVPFSIIDRSKCIVENERIESIFSHTHAYTHNEYGIELIEGGLNGGKRGRKGERNEFDGQSFTGKIRDQAYLDDAFTVNKARPHPRLI